MSPPKRFGILAFATVLASACNSPHPIVPTPAGSSVPVTISPLPPLAPYDITRIVVDANDDPVPGASVRFGVADNLSMVTDTGGVFKATVQLRQPSVEIRVEKPGYEPSLFDASANPGNFPDFRN